LGSSPQLFSFSPSFRGFYMTNAIRDCALPRFLWFGGGKFGMVGKEKG